ncbi:phosphopantetheine-binding protein [Streptomyces sp. NPDC091387]|uniref:phosphopantetheine-binding protein n=1 Tax=unclassified Streptomyces TaxID=2593676 RepID=UPI00365DA582
MSAYDVEGVVRSVIVEAMGLAPEKYTEDLSFSADLGLDSLDLLDVFFRIECCVPLIITVERCGRYLQGEVPDAEFCDENGVISRRGLERLHVVMPQLDPEIWAGRLTLDRMLDRLTVGNLVAMVEHMLGKGRPVHA